MGTSRTEELHQAALRLPGAYIAPGPGTCRDCGQIYRSGDPITKHPHAGHRHAVCAGRPRTLPGS